MGIRYTREDFINKSIEKHGDKYDYSLVEYVNSKTIVKIICPIHDEFEQRPDTHMSGGVCKRCAKTKTHTKFVKEANKIHNNKYTYPNKYIRAKVPMLINCNVHGEFPQTPDKHLQGQGCPKCVIFKGKKNHTQFVEEANNIHNNKYTYPEKYIKSDIKIIINCDIHGDFPQLPSMHIQGQGCPDCANEKYRKTQQEFIEQSNKVHDNKYEYPGKYFNKNTKIKISCPIHGDFYKKPIEHIRGEGCQKCSNDKKKFTTYDFINIANSVHNSLYSYDNCNYDNMKTNVLITCSIHGDFSQLPKDHINNKTGCPYCRLSKGELEIKRLLENYEIEFINQKRFKDCKDKIHLPFDFYLPVINTCIEYDGKQHFESVDMWGGEKGLKDRQRRDNIKDEYCENENIKLIRIRYDENIEEKLKKELYKYEQEKMVAI